MAKKITPLASITIQPAPSADDPLKLPYPYIIEVPTGYVLRQDFWKGAPLSLVCFLHEAATNPTSEQIDKALHLSKFLRHPKKAIGMYPVFQYKNGDWRTHATPIETIRIKEK